MPTLSCAAGDPEITSAGVLNSSWRDRIARFQAMNAPLPGRSASLLTITLFFAWVLVTGFLHQASCTTFLAPWVSRGCSDAGLVELVTFAVLAQKSPDPLIEVRIRQLDFGMQGDQQSHAFVMNSIDRPEMQ